MVKRDSDPGAAAPMDAAKPSQSQLPERNIGLAAGVVNDLTPHRSIRDNGLLVHSRC